MGAKETLREIGEIIDDLRAIDRAEIYLRDLKAEYDERRNRILTEYPITIQDEHLRGLEKEITARLRQFEKQLDVLQNGETT